MDDQDGHVLARIVGDLKALGVAPERDVLVHCSMRRVGSVHKGPRTLHNALCDVVGEARSVVVPTHTAINSTTSHAYHTATKGMNDVELAGYEARMKGFDPLVTRSYQMGRLAEYLRVQPGAERSTHPQTSFAARGANAKSLMQVHRLESHLGEESPLGALYREDALILLIGVGYEANTALHLAEYRLDGAPRRPYRCYVDDRGVRQRCDFIGLDLDDSDFGRLGIALDRQPFVGRGTVGDATARAMPLRPTVDFAVGWMQKHRRQ